MQLPFFKIQRGLIPLLILGMLILAGCSLASEPVPVGPIETGPQPGEAAAANLPVNLPRASNGAVIYLAHCASCHGATGAGDGEFADQLRQQGATFPDFTDPGLARSRSPQDWWTTITLGTIINGGLMPPWRDTLTDSERWDVAYYLYSLSTPPDVLDEGKSLFEQNCTECHGPDGPQADVLTDIGRMAALSPQSIFNRIMRGEDGIHDFSSLSEDEGWSVTAYARTFAYDSSIHAAAAEAPTESAAAEATPVAGESSPPDTTGSETAPIDSITVQGTVTTADGSSLPAGIELTLQGISVDASGNFTPFLEQNGVPESDGSFRFEGLPADQTSAAYIVTALYNGVEFTNGALIEPGQSVLEVPITIYEVTDDASVVTVSQAHFVLREHPDALLVLEVLVFDNSSDKVYLSDQLVRGGQRGSVSITVPSDAYSISFEEGQLGGRFVEAGDRVWDTQQVQPGQSTHSIIVTYVVPFSGSREFTVPMDYGAKQVTVLTQGDGTVKSNLLNPAGTEVISNESYNKYVGQNFAPGDTLNFTMQVGLGTTFMRIAPTLAAVLGVLLVFTGIAYWVIRRREGPDLAPALASMTPAQNELAKQIADLDEAYEAGKINRFDYETRRAALKAQLAAALREE